MIIIMSIVLYVKVSFMTAREQEDELSSHFGLKKPASEKKSANLAQPDSLAGSTRESTFKKDPI